MVDHEEYIISHKWKKPHFSSCSLSVETCNTASTDPTHPEVLKNKSNYITAHI